MTFERNAEPSAKTAKAQPKRPLPFLSRIKLGFHVVLPTSVPCKLPSLTFYARSNSHFRASRHRFLRTAIRSNCHFPFSFFPQLVFARMQRDLCGDWCWKPCESFWRLKWENSRPLMWVLLARSQQSLTTNLHAVVFKRQRVMHTYWTHGNTLFFLSFFRSGKTDT